MFQGLKGCGVVGGGGVQFDGGGGGECMHVFVVGGWVWSCGGLLAVMCVCVCVCTVWRRGEGVGCGWTVVSGWLVCFARSDWGMCKNQGG